VLHAAELASPDEYAAMLIVDIPALCVMTGRFGALEAGNPIEKNSTSRGQWFRFIENFTISRHGPADRYVCKAQPDETQQSVLALFTRIKENAIAFRSALRERSYRRGVKTHLAFFILLVVLYIIRQQVRPIQVRIKYNDRSQI
jgi:hypothetical protein